jgi:hypothetical protein
MLIKNKGRAVSDPALVLENALVPSYHPILKDYEKSKN